MQVPDAIILERQSWNPRGLWRLLFWNERSQLPWLKWVWHREHTKRCIYSSEKSSILKTSLKRIENDLTSQSVSARSKVFVYFDLEIIKLVLLTERLRILSILSFVNCLFRDITLHQNGWYCDCHILELHHWLQNFTMPNEPKCRSPDRVSGDEIKSLQQNEFSCKPEVSPNSMFLEVVVGKNMSLICNVEVSACL